MLRSASRRLAAGPITRKAIAACIVPPHVRKSFAVMSPPVISRRGSLMSSEVIEWRLAVARLAVGGVVAILLAPSRVARGRLDVTVGIGTDPHVGPRGWNRERVESPALVGIADAHAVGREVGPPAARALARDPRNAVRHIREPRARRGLAMLAQARRAHGLNRPPSRASRSSNGAGFQWTRSMLSNSRMRARALSSPRLSAHHIGPPRQAGKP